MKLLIIGEYLRKLPWSPSAWAGDLARGLARRGHDITLACDGAEDPATLDGLPLLIRRPARTVRGADPLGFQRWAQAIRARLADHTSLSLTPWCAADVWLRLDADSARAVLRAVRGHRPLSAALELLHRPWLPAALLAERRALAAGQRSSSIHFGAGLDDHDSTLLMHASRLPRHDQAQTDHRRAAVRTLLGINPARETLLLSTTDIDGPALADFLAGFARARRAGRSPLLLVLGRRSYTVSTAAARANCEPGAVRHLGATAEVSAALAACDVAVIPGPDRGASAGARFLADALRLGRPVLAHRDAPGAALLEPAHFGTAPLGLLADGTPDGWARAIDTALADGWLARAQGAAHDAGPALSMDGLLDRIERRLALA